MRFAVLLLLLAGPAVGGCAKHAPPGGDDGAPRETVLVNQGVALLQKGDCKGAIKQGFDPAIAIYRAGVASSGARHVYVRGGLGAVFAAAIMGLPSDPTIDTAVLGAVQDALSGDASAGAKLTPTDTVVMRPDFPDTLYFKGYCLSELGDVNGARAAVSEALTMLPGDPMYLCELGDEDQRQKDWTGAMERFRAAEATAKRLVDANDTAASPMGKAPVLWETRALRGVGYSLTELGRLDESREVYFQILRLDPNDEKAKQELTYIATLQAHGQ